MPLFFMVCWEERHAKSSAICRQPRILLSRHYKGRRTVYRLSTTWIVEVNLGVGECMGESSEQRTGLFRSLGEERFSPQVKQGPHDETGPFADQHQQGR